MSVIIVAFSKIFFVELSVLSTNHTAHKTLMRSNRFSHAEQIVMSEFGEIRLGYNSVSLSKFPDLLVSQ